MATFTGGGGKDTIFGNNKTTDWGGRDDEMFGKGDNDALYGMRGDDRLFGGGGNDTLVGGDGNDDVFGDSGNDRMIYQRGDDTFDGGSGTDTLAFRSVVFATGAFDVVTEALEGGRSIGIDYNVATGIVRNIGGERLGTLSLTSVEVLNFTSNDDIITNDDIGRTIQAVGGNDTVRGGAGADIIDLGIGNDVVDGGRGNDAMTGGSGTDELSFASWNGVTVPNGSTFSTLISLVSPFAGPGSASLVSVNGQGIGSTLETDRLTGFENVTGTKFNDAISGTDGANRLRGDKGDDVLSGKGGADVLTGGEGNDRISGGAGADRLDGNDNVDTLDYSLSSVGVRINLREGTASGGDAEGDRFSNFENITGSRNADELTGDLRRNVIKGNGGSDTIDGHVGNDTIDGGAGRDFLIGNIGKDTLTGGSGIDDFIFKSTADSRVGLADTITDFLRGTDRIDLSAIDAITGNVGNDNFTVFIPVVPAPQPGDVPAIPVTPGAGTLVLTANSLDKDGDGFAESLLNVVSGHVDADGQADFELRVITSVESGRLTGSDFLL